MIACLVNESERPRRRTSNKTDFILYVLTLLRFLPVCTDLGMFLLFRRLIPSQPVDPFISRRRPNLVSDFVVQLETWERLKL